MNVKPKIFIGTPMYGMMCYGAYTINLIELHTIFCNNKWDVKYDFIGNESLITRARDNIAYNFLQSDCTHLLFLDSDIAFNATDVERMINEDLDLLCGVYCAKEIKWDRVEAAVNAGCATQHLPFAGLRPIFATDNHYSFTDMNIIEVDYSGTGYMLIKREVFEKLIPHTETYIGNTGPNKGKTIHAFFQVCIDEYNNMLSEDYYFCREWRKIGGKVNVALYARAAHYGSYGYGNVGNGI